MSLFRLILGYGLFVLMVILYWSSILVEQDLKFIQRDLAHMKHELFTIKKDLDKQTQSFAHLKPQSYVPSAYQDKFSMVGNLLTPDVFYTTTLPRLLGPDFKPSGIRQEATIGKPDNLHPFNNWSEVANWNALCLVSLAGQDLGKYETLTPDMAIKMELRHEANRKPEYWLTLRQDVFWQPLDPHHFSGDLELDTFFLQKHQVTAHDFKFYYDVVMNPYVSETQAVALRNFYSDIEEVRVVDDFTLVVRWKTKKVKDKEGKEVEIMKYMAKSLTGALRPLARFVYQYFADGTKIVADDENPDTYRTNPIWAQNFAHHWANNVIVSCGPWLFDGFTDREIRFKRNPDYHDPYAVLVDAYEIKFRDSSDSIWEDFRMGSLDLFQVPPELLANLDQFLHSAPYQEQVQEGLAVKQLDFLGRSFQYIGWNETNPLFNNHKVRQALTMAIDRERIIRQNLNGMAVQNTGPFFPFSPSYDANLQPYPFDAYQARQLLQEEGWYDSDQDGVIDKLINGKRVPFRFTLTYFVKNAATKAISEYVATALKQIGIDCKPNGVDLADLSNVFEDKNFDAVVLGWGLGTPPEDLKQLWYSAGAKEKGSSNAIGFANAEADHIIEQLEYESDAEKRLELYHRFHAIIYEQAPYTFLYTPKIRLAYREYLQNVFIPAERQDLIPGANVGEPQPSIYWIRDRKG